MHVKAKRYWFNRPLLAKAVMADTSRTCNTCYHSGYIVENTIDWLNRVDFFQYSPLSSLLTPSVPSPPIYFIDVQIPVSASALDRPVFENTLVLVSSKRPDYWHALCTEAIMSSALYDAGLKIKPEAQTYRFDDIPWYILHIASTVDVRRPGVVVQQRTSCLQWDNV